MILDDAVVNEDVDMDDIDTSGLKKRIRKRIYRIIRIMNSHYSPAAQINFNRYNSYLATALLELWGSLAWLTFSLTLVVITLFSITAVESLEDILGLTIGHTAFGIGARFPIVV